MVAGEAVLPDGPSAQPARPIRAGFEFSIFRNHPGIIPPGPRSFDLGKRDLAVSRGHEKAGPRRDPLLLMRCSVSYCRTILRARRPPATSRAPAPSANSDAPPVLGSEPPAAEAAEAEPPPPPPPPALAVEVALAVTVAAEAEAVLMFTSRPAAMLLKHASTWFWSTPSSCARAARASWSFSTLY
jgi:hypothetical protein